MHNMYILLISLAVFTFLPAGATGQSGFLSLNCGGQNYNDTNTLLGWVSDDSYTDHGTEARIEVQQENVSVSLQTLRFFPGGDRNNKYCYSLPGLGESKTYLIRASFLYGNYDGKNHPPSFVLILNYDIWSNVSTPAGSATEPTVYEIMYVSSSDLAVVCLARHPESSETPFISTLELRPLEDTMYNRGQAINGNRGALDSGYGLHLAHRENYGANTSEAVRYPNDRFDRIWVTNTIGPILSINSNEIITVNNPDTPPAQVMATAITTKGLGNLSVVFEDFGGDGHFFIQFHFARLSNSAPVFNCTFPGSTLHAIPVSGLSFAYSYSKRIDQQASLKSPFVATLIPYDNPTVGPFLNAIELLQWSPNPLRRNSTLPADLQAIQNLQNAFNLMDYGDGDPCLPQYYTWSWVVCNTNLEPRIIEIHLTNFNLNGEISTFINNLSALQKIYLADNKLTGSIPDLNSLTSLEVLDLHNNELSGQIPSSLEKLLHLTQLNLEGNTNLCGTIPPLLLQNKINLTYFGDSNLCTDSQCRCPSSPSMTTLSTKNSSTKIYIYIISSVAFVYVISMLGMFLLYKKVRDRRSNIPTKEGDNVMKDIPFATKNLTYEEVTNATTQFSNKIGEGGFGQVFYGVLKNGQVVAVKTLADASRQGLKEFATEVAILSRLHHKNLVSLVGYCIEKTYMLIYEYISKGNLRDLLYGEFESIDKPLPWRIRVQIALNAAQGLEYLHMGCDPTIIHRDVKSSNILLNDKMQAKVADFGLSRLKEGDSTVSHVSTANVVGTVGYLDPAYNATNQLTDKSDVYSFGIVLFELICGRPPIDVFSSPPHIVDWVTSNIQQGRQGNIGDIVDPVLTNGYKLESMWKVIDVAFGCVERDRSKRPTMSEVVHVLREAAKIEMEYTPRSQDVSGSSSTSDGKPPNLRYIESPR